MPLAALDKTSSAFANPDLKPKSPNCCLNLSLLITIRESTLALSSSTPCSACLSLLGPSKLNGTVTIPTVRIPISLAIFAITGAAPVPVPPPIPAVMKTILVLFPSIALISSMLSSAAFLPTSGSAPAPKPSVSLTPSWILLATGFSANACASVLQTTKSTPFIPFSYMCFRALFPPPPTPITFMIEDVPFGKRISKPDSLFKISIVFSISFLKLIILLPRKNFLPAPKTSAQKFSLNFLKCLFPLIQ